VAKDIRLEWQYDFMLAFREPGSAANADQKLRKLILLSNSEELFELFMIRFTSAVMGNAQPEEGSSAASSPKPL